MNSLELAHVTPFNLLSNEQHQLLSRHSDLVYLDEQQTLVIRSQPNSERFLLLVFKGRGQWQTGDDDKDIIHANESAGALILLQGGEGRFTALEEVLAYRISGTFFDQLCQENDAFSAYWSAGIRDKLNRLEQREQTDAFANFMMLTATDVRLIPIVTLTDQLSLQQASQALRQQQASAGLVHLPDKELGIITTTDLLNAFTDYAPADYPLLSQLAKPKLVCMQQDDHLFKALVLMTEHNLSHIVIMREQQPMGILPQKTLLGALANQSVMMGQQLEQAQTLKDLHPIQQGLTSLIQSLHHKGVNPRFIAELVSSLNRVLFRKISLLTRPASLAECDYALLIMGSEGRQEQILRTDQDNALIWQGNPDSQQIKHWASAMHDALAELGFPDCPGNIMMTNPLWQQSLDSLLKQVHEWMHQPSNQSMMYLSILLDADTAAGNAELTQRLLAQVKSAVANNRAFMGHFAKSALEFETPLGLFSQFKTTKQGQLDLKKGGLFPIVHGARVLMCEHSLTASTTHERLMALANTRTLSQSFASELVEAFDFMQQLRLHQQLTSLSLEQPIDNQIHVDSLSHLQKDLLKDSFKLVDQFKNLLNHHYKLNQLM